MNTCGDHLSETASDSSLGFNFQPPLTNESNLLQQQESGLSSSSYELSQYMADASEPYHPAASAAWRPIQDGGYQSDQGVG